MIQADKSLFVIFGRDRTEFGRGESKNDGSGHEVEKNMWT